MKILACVLFLFLIHTNIQVRSAATFEWLMISYNNPGGEVADGSTCDWIAGDCDHAFRFELHLPNGNGNTPILVKTTTPFDNTNKVVFPSNQEINGFYNPITHTFEKWPGGLLLKIHVEDNDDGFVSKNPELVEDFSYRVEASPTLKSNSVSHTASAGLRTTLEFTWKVYCEDNYYGDDCSKSCIPSNDDLKGHFLCDPKGDKICLPGWDNVATNCREKKDFCKENQCKNGAGCQNGDNSYVCNCKPGYSGTYCEIITNKCSSNPCLNGSTCVNEENDYKCFCKPENVGKNCDEKACANAQPCLNGGTCYADGKCFCTPYFSGSICQDPLCKVVGCMNSGVCTLNGTCACLPGFLGDRCEVDLCDSVEEFCKNGGTCKGGKCDCPKGFEGDACEESAVCNGRQCVNGSCVVTYVDTSIAVPQCQCFQGYSGVRCDKGVVGETLPYQSEQNASMPLFTVLFIIFVIISFIFLIIIIVLAVLLCKKRRLPNRNRTHSGPYSSSSTSEIYSTVTESRSSEGSKSEFKISAIPNLYHEYLERPSLNMDHDEPSKKESMLDDVFVVVDGKC